MKKKHIIVCAVILLGSLLLSGCYTSQKGVVPCPQFGAIKQNVNSL